MSQGERGQAKHQGGGTVELGLGKTDLKAASSPSVWFHLIRRSLIAKNLSLGK